MNDEDEIKDNELDGDLDLETDDDLLISGQKKPKKLSEDDSLDELADEEDVVLPEDEFDDKDLW